MSRYRKAVALPPAVGDDGDALEQAWRLIAAQQDAVARVDGKASFALTLESAVLAAAATTEPAAHGWVSRGLMLPGLGLVAAGVLFAVAVVMPQLRTRQLAREWRTSRCTSGTCGTGRPTSWPSNCAAVTCSSRPPGSASYWPGSPGPSTASCSCRWRRG